MNKIFKNNKTYLPTMTMKNEEDDNNNEEYLFENQNENRNEDIVLHINENNASEYTTPESTTSPQNASQTETSTTSKFVGISTRIVSPRVYKVYIYIYILPKVYLYLIIFAHLLQTNSLQSNFPLQNQITSYSNIVQPAQRRSQNPPLSHISIDPLYQMNQHTTYNPTTISPPVNMIQPVAPPPQFIPKQQDTFINTSASIPEPMKPFDGLDHSYTPEEYLQQVEARLTFAIGEEPQNNPINNRSWHNRRMAYIQCSLIGTALDWCSNLHISYKQQWSSFVQLFKKQFSSQKTARYAQVEAMSLMKKDNETVRQFALRVQQ